MAMQNRIAADSNFSQKWLSYANAKMFNVSKKDFNFSFGAFNQILPSEWVVT